MNKNCTSKIKSAHQRPHPELTSDIRQDQTIVRSNQILDPVILFWKHTVCVGLGCDQKSRPSGTSTWV